jgi:hypothetical protein
MTKGGSGNDEPDVDAARQAMRRVHELFEEYPGASVEQIRGLEGYETIPERVQRAIEELSLGERLLVHQVFSELMGAGFYIQGEYGPRMGY